MAAKSTAWARVKADAAASGLELEVFWARYGPAGVRPHYNRLTVADMHRATANYAAVRPDRVVPAPPAELMAPANAALEIAEENAYIEELEAEVEGRAVNPADARHLMNAHEARREVAREHHAQEMQRAFAAQVPEGVVRGGWEQRAMRHNVVHVSALQLNRADIYSTAAAVRQPIIDELSRVRDHTRRQGFAAVRVTLVAKCDVIRRVNGENYSHYARDPQPVVVRHADNLRDVVDSMLARVVGSIGDVELRGSDLDVDRVEEITLELVEADMAAGRGWIPLPEWIASSKCVINPKNDDDKCFVYAVAAVDERLKTHRERVDSKKMRKAVAELNTSMLRFPVAVDDAAIAQFETANNLSIAIWEPVGYGSVGEDEPAVGEPDEGEPGEGEPDADEDARSKERLVPQRAPTNPRGVVVNLLYWEQDVDGVRCGHYGLIRNLGGLRSRETSHGDTVHTCRHCLLGLSSAAILAAHEPDCLEKAVVGTSLKMPAPNTYMQYTEKGARMMQPLCVYADFESVLEPVEPGTSSGSTTVLHRHRPCAASARVVDMFGDTVAEGNWFAADAEDLRSGYVVHEFTKFIRKWSFELKKLNSKIEIEWGKEPLSAPHGGAPDGVTDTRAWYESCNKCWVCNEEIQAGLKVADHCHYSGRLRGPAHSACNLALRWPAVLPVWLHNGGRYDMHFITDSLYKKNYTVDAVATTLDSYITLTLNRRVSIRDSFKHLAGSLEKLTESLVNKRVSTDEKLRADFRSTWRLAVNWAEQHSEDGEEEVNIPELFKLLLRKGVYPYEHLSDISKLDAKELPPREAFYSQLSGSGVSEKDYNHAMRVWRVANVKNMREYTELYLRLDVALLADVFEGYRHRSIKGTGLDPAFYPTLPSFGHQVMLRMTKVKFELLSDINMYTVVERAKRGGYSGVLKRLAIANVPSESNYDPKKPISHIIYKDANNLYGAAMMLHLATGGYRWELDSEWTIERIMSHLDLAHQQARGALLEADVSFPDECHDRLSSFPVLPEVCEVRTDMLSPYQRMLKEATHAPESSGEKLIAHLGPRTRYVIDVRALAYYLSLGVRLDRVHRVLTFDQSDWLGVFVKWCATQRAAAPDTLTRDMFKLVANSVYGRSLMDKRRHGDVVILTCADVEKENKKIRRYAASPTFRQYAETESGVGLLAKRKKETLLDTHITVGVQVLDLSKLIVAKWWYDTVQPLWGNRVEALYTDTDSLVMHVESGRVVDGVMTDCYWTDLAKIASTLDMSNQPKGVVDTIPELAAARKNKNVPGYFKDECAVEVDVTLDYIDPATDDLAVVKVPVHKEIHEFVALRAKCYSYSASVPSGEEGVVASVKDDRRLKGISKSVARKIACDDYLWALELSHVAPEHSVSSHSMTRLASSKHAITTVRQEKRSLNPYDDKRYILEDGITTLPFGHYRTRAAAAAAAVAQ